jgi:glycine oxidase
VSAAADVLVVGAGVIGLGCAYELAGAGLRVTVVDRAEAGMEASGASAGLLSAYPSRRPDALERLYRLSRERYVSLAETLRSESGVDIEHGRAGHIAVLMDEVQVGFALKLAAEFGTGEERVEFLAAEDLRRLEPEVSRDARGALLLTGGGWVNNERLVIALVRAAAVRGVRFVLGHAAEEILATDGRVTGVRARGVGKLSAGTVLLAAGAWSSQIAGAPAALELRPVKGQVVALAHTPPVIHHALLLDELYLVPRQSGECLVGATVEEGVADKHVTAEAMHSLLRGALGLVPALRGTRISRAWAGLRPATEDGLPVIGPWPDRPGLIVATGHFRSGIHLMPLTARLVREWIVDGRTTLRAPMFLPDRFLRGPQDFRA